MKNLLPKFLLFLIVLGSLNLTKAQYVWTQKTNFPGALRNGGAAFTVGHFGYVGNGSASTNYYYDWWRWDQNTNSWTSVTAYPGAGSQGCIYFALNGNGYVGLGKNASGTQTDFWMYDTTTNSWTRKANFPGRARYGGNISFSRGNNGYVMGGNPGGPPYMNDCWKYNSITDSWSQIDSFPLFNYTPCVTFGIGTGYAGCASSSSLSDLNDSMYRYDTALNSWHRVAPLSFVAGEVSTTVFSLGDTGYSVSGFDKNGYYLHEVFSYNSVSNSWNSLPNFPGVPRIGGVGFSIGNKGYVVMGSDSNTTFYNDLWQYAPSNTLGISNISNSINISVFPNPTNGSFNIINSNLEFNSGTVSIYNLLGECVYVQKIEDANQINITLSGNEKGVFFVKLLSTHGSGIVGKVIVE